MRAELEGLAAELAAKWISDNQLKRLRNVHSKFVLSVKNLRRRKDDSSHTQRTHLKLSNVWIKTNEEFHGLILEGSNNLRLCRVIDELYVGFISNVMYSSARGMDAHRMQQNISDHARILRALEKRDAVEARKAMQAHIVEGGRFVIAWLENQMSVTRA